MERELAALLGILRSVSRMDSERSGYSLNGRIYQVTVWNVLQKATPPPFVLDINSSQMREILWLAARFKYSNVPERPEGQVTGSGSVRKATFISDTDRLFLTGQTAAVCRSPVKKSGMNRPFHCLLLSSLFCRGMEVATKERFITKSPLGSCFLVVPCLTSLSPERAELSTQLSRCLRQVILFPLIFLSNSKPD